MAVALMVVIAAATVVVQAGPRVTAAAAIRLPATAEGAAIRPLAVVEPRTVAAERPMVEAVAADMGGNIALEFWPA